MFDNAWEHPSGALSGAQKMVKSLQAEKLARSRPGACLNRW